MNSSSHVQFALSRTRTRTLVAHFPRLANENEGNVVAQRQTGVRTSDSHFTRSR